MPVAALVSTPRLRALSQRASDLAASYRQACKAATGERQLLHIEINLSWPDNASGPVAIHLRSISGAVWPEGDLYNSGPGGSPASAMRYVKPPVLTVNLLQFVAGPRHAGSRIICCVLVQTADILREAVYL